MAASNKLGYVLGETWQWFFVAATPGNVNLTGVVIRWRLYSQDKVLVEISIGDGITIVDNDQHICLMAVPPGKQLTINPKLTLAGVLLRHETELIFLDGTVSIQCQGQFALRYGSFIAQNIMVGDLLIGAFTSTATLT